MSSTRRAAVVLLSTGLFMFEGGCPDPEPPAPSDLPNQPDLAPTADGGAPMDAGGTDEGGPSPDAQGISCSPTIPTPITTLNRGVRALAVDGAHVFWVAHVSGLAGAYRAPKAGGEATQLFPVRDLQDDAYDWDLVVDGDVLFLSDSGDAGVSPGSGPIWRVTSPGNATKLAEGESYPCRGAGHPRRLAIDSNRVYWTEDVGRYIGDYEPSPEPTCDPNMSFRFLRSVSKGGGDVRRLARVTSINAVLGGDFAYFANGTTLYRLPKAGGTPQPVAAGLATDRPLLAIDGDQIYVGGPDASVQVVDRNRGTIRSIAGASDTFDGVQQFAFDERYVYWASDGDGGGIRRAPKSGGAVELVVSGSTYAVAVDENYLYWNEMRRCK